MCRLTHFIRRLVVSSSGASTVENILMVALVLSVLLIGYDALGKKSTNVFKAVGKELQPNRPIVRPFN